MCRHEPGLRVTVPLLKQLGMRAGTHENNQAGFAAIVEFVRQQEITANVALPMPFPIATQRVIEPLRAKWGIMGDQHKHGFLESVHVVPARS